MDTCKCPTVLLKADTGADMNLMNSIMFDKVIGDRTVLQLTSLRMEAYGNNTEFQGLGKFHAFLRWKNHVYRQFIYITNANTSPNLLSLKGWLLHFGSVKVLLFHGNSRKFQWIPRRPQVTPTQPTVTSYNAKMHVDLSHHCRNEGSAKEKGSHSNK